MQGIDLSRKLYFDKVKPMIESEFALYADRIAIGLVGHGSECYGFDDEVSKDHDYCPSLCLWINDEDDREFGFKLLRAYNKIQKESASDFNSESSLGAKNIRGVMLISDFYKKYTGKAGAPEDLWEWVSIPSYYLAEATNGEVFYDPKGEFSAIRERIKYGMPEDARLKRMASCAFLIAQTGQYNFSRCISHGEIGAARLALADFAKNAIEMIFLLNRRYAPYYKWSLRAMKDLDKLSNVAADIELMLSNNDTVQISETIEAICFKVIEELKNQGITDSDSSYLEHHAYSINSRIKNAELRNSHIVI